MSRLIVWAIRFWRRANKRYRKCLAHIEALERELMPWLFETTALMTQIERNSQNPDLLEFRPGAVWEIDAGEKIEWLEDSQLTPQAAIQRAYAQAQSNAQGALAARGACRSGEWALLAERIREHNRALNQAYLDQFVNARAF